MFDETLSFVTPYWSGPEMMRIHLASVRQFYPAAPILVSKRGGDHGEMEGYRSEFGVQYWLEDCNYVDALLRLLERCETKYVCILDHDTVLLSSLDPLLQGLMEERWNLVGVEERIREAPGVEWSRFEPLYNNGWWRFAPGSMDSNFIMFDLREFVRKWGLRGVGRKGTPSTWNSEYHYGICQKLKGHKYLMPYHVRKYGVGNLLKEGDTTVLWHQWYGALRTRLQGTEHEAYQSHIRKWIAVLKQGERAFLADYPRLDFSDTSPAWGPDCDVQAEQLAISQKNDHGLLGLILRDLSRVSNWPRYGLRGLLRRGVVRLGRWRHFR